MVLTHHLQGPLTDLLRIVGSLEAAQEVVNKENHKCEGVKASVAKLAKMTPGEESQKFLESNQYPNAHKLTGTALCSMAHNGCPKPLVDVI